MLEVVPSDCLLLVSIPLAVDLFGPPVILVVVTGQLGSALLPPLTLATMMVAQMVQ